MSALQLPRHGDGKHSALVQSVEWCCCDVVAAGHARTAAGLANQLSNGMVKVDVVVGQSQVVDPLERSQRGPLQSVVANQPAHNRQFFYWTSSTAP